LAGDSTKFGAKIADLLKMLENGEHFGLDILRQVAAIR
jgi:hypothetical protein